VRDLRQKLKEFYNDCDVYRRNLEEFDENWYDGCLKFFYEHFPERNVCILDLGCGIGTTTRYLGNGFKRVIGLDYSLEFCRYSHEKNKDRKAVCIINGDATSLPFKDESLQGIFSYATVEHLYDVKGAFREMDRVLKKGGVILIHMPDLLTPLRPLKAILSREKLNYPKPESGNNRVHSFCLILRDIFFLLRKWGLRDANFLSREPNFEIVEGDYDAVYLSSPLDIKKHFRKQNYRVEDLTFPYRPYGGRGWIKKALKWLLYKTRILRMIRMSSGTYSTLVLRKS
jgi:SAM-dependent methyltransferase